MEVRVLSTAPLFKSVVIGVFSVLNGKAVLGARLLNQAISNAFGDSQFEYGTTQANDAISHEFPMACEEYEHRL